MPTTHERLETLIAKVRRLPESRQVAVIEALREITDEPYQLTDEERAILTAARDEADRGQYLFDAETDDLLNKPWA